MSTHEVLVTYLEDVFDHPNADRLELAIVGNTEWQVVVGAGEFIPGDPCIYIPIDSVLGKDIEDYLFPLGSKVTLSKSRVRSIKLRGALSQGMAIKVDSDLIIRVRGKNKFAGTLGRHKDHLALKITRQAEVEESL